MEEEFIEMINMHRGILYKVCNLYCKDPEDKRDLFQEMVLQIWRSLKSYRKDSKVSTWMYRVALNTAITNFRKESRRPGRLAISETELQIPDITDLAERSENQSLLKEAIEQLNAIEKAIIMLYLDERSYEEIASILGITRTNVGVKLNRIKSKLELIVKTKLI